MGDIDNVFSIDFGRHGNLSELDFNIEPNDTDSGGYADIVSLALRIAVIELYKPKINGMLIFDEPFKCISKEYIQSASQFLTSISKKINRQLIVVSHIDEISDSADNLIKVV
jgi:DNA repair exonuclease SbcCD ATPase subunit